MSRLFAGVVWGNVALRLQTTVALRRRQVLARKLVILALQSKFTVRYISPLGLISFLYSVSQLLKKRLFFSMWIRSKKRKTEIEWVELFSFIELCYSFVLSLHSSVLYIHFFFQLSSVSSADEIKFKTIIPASSLVVRDHCWLNDAGKSSIFFSSTWIFY